MWSNPLRRGQVPAFVQFRSSQVLIVTTISYAIFTDLFLYAVIVPVLPFTLADRIGIPEHQVQLWVSICLAVYAGAILVGSPFCGYMADRVQNRRIPLLMGAFVLVLSTLLLCFSRNIPMLLIGRILQGLSGAVTWPVGLALMLDTVGTEKAGASAGYVGIAYSLGLLVGPLFGGLVFAKAGYYAVFGMSFGFVAFDVLLRLLILEKVAAKKLLDSASITATSEPGDSSMNESGVSEKEVMQSEKIRVKPGMRQSYSTSGPNSIRKILVRPRLLAALWGTVVASILSTCFDSTLPLFVSDTFGWKSLGAGLIFLPFILPCIVSPVAGLLSDKYGPKPFVTLGFLWLTPFLVCLRFVAKNTMSHKIMLCGLLLGCGISEIFIFSPVAAEISWAVEMDGGNADPDFKPPYGLSYGLYNVAFSIGATVGPIMGGLIREHAGWGTLCWSLGIISFVTALVMLLFLGGPLKMLRRGQEEEEEEKEKEKGDAA